MTITPAERPPELIDATHIMLTGTRELRQRTPLFNVLAVLTVAAAVGAMGARRPEFLGLAAPLIAMLALGFARWRPVVGEVRLGIDSPHLVEGDEFAVLVEIDGGEEGLERVEVELKLGERVSTRGTLRSVTSVAAGTTRHLAFPVSADEWGVGTIEQVTIRVTDRFGLFGGTVSRSANVSMRIGLAEDRLKASLEADRFRRVVGSHLSSDRGQGLEIADIRPYLPGDSMRDINWRITNRRQEPWVTLRPPDRSATVVVIVDAHDGESEARSTTQRRSVAAAMALARGHLSNHDPVGLLVVGHTVRWLPPRLGRNQLHRIADELISVSNAPDASLRMYRPPAIHNISKETIVVAVTPLRDPLMVSLVAELRSRGNTIAVLAPEVEEEPPSRIPFLVEGRTSAMARRLASAEQAVGIQSLRAHGVVMVPWAVDEPVTVVIDAVRRLRQSMRRVTS